LLAVPASAAVAGRVAHELGAEGQVTNRMILLTSLNTLYAVLAMTLFHAWWQADQSADVLQSVMLLASSFAGSLALAALLAAVVAAAARRLDLRNESSVLLVLGLVLLAISTARIAGLSTLLVPLLAGLILRNVTDRPWVWPPHFGTAGGVFVLTLFVIVGASWSPATLALGGAAALALVGARLAAKGIAVVLFSHWAGASLKQGIALAITLTPLSATVLVMLSELQNIVPELGATVAPIILTAVALLELLGPIAVQFGLRLAGDLGPSRPSRRKEQR
jgi:Kef-type K+ transport system membrane component KefB